MFCPQGRSDNLNNIRFFGILCMRFLLKTLLLLSFALSGQTTLASPRDDARLIVQRSVNPEFIDFVEQKLKRQFVDVYFKPISGQGISINDIERFTDLIPDEDITPFVDRMLSQTVENLLSTYTPKQLASIATIMREDKDVTLNDILSEQYQQKYILALEQSRSTIERSGSDDPIVVGLEELIIQLDAMTESLNDDSGKALAQEFAIGVGQIFALVRFNQEIARIERELDNPVTVAALKADGILKFANPVQKQTILRKLSASESSGSIRFLRPPPAKTQSN